MWIFFNLWGESLSKLKCGFKKGIVWGASYLILKKSCSHVLRQQWLAPTAISQITCLSVFHQVSAFHVRGLSTIAISISAPVFVPSKWPTLGCAKFSQWYWVPFVSSMVDGGTSWEVLLWQGAAQSWCHSTRQCEQWTTRQERSQRLLVLKCTVRLCLGTRPLCKYCT